MLLFIMYFLIFVACWLLIGLYNQIQTKKQIENYRIKYKQYEKLEEEATDIKMKTSFFLRRMKLESEYPILYRFMLSYDEDSESVSKESQRLFFLLGPLFNLLP